MRTRCLIGGERKSEIGEKIYLKSVRKSIVRLKDEKKELHIIAKWKDRLW